MHWVVWVSISLLFIGCGSAWPSPLPGSSMTPEEKNGRGALHDHQAGETISSMSSSHAHLGPHFRWTAKRPPNIKDQQKAKEIAQELRRVLARYRDYRRAIEDGFEPFLPDVPQPHYHFTSKWRGLKAAFRFNAAEPTSLLYRKTPGGYELEGAMYTAPKRANEDALDSRIPLSVAQWHAHVDICLPPRQKGKTADWKKFGPNGSIVTERECDAVKGRWIPQLFGWMVHVYPFEDTQETIWTH